MSDFYVIPFEQDLDFAREVRGFLLAHEAENQVALSLIEGILLGTPSPSYPLKARLGIYEGSTLVGVAILNRDYPLLVSSVPSLAIETLVQFCVEKFPDLPGVIGIEEFSVPFSKLWSERTGAKSELSMHQGVYACEKLLRSRPLKGKMRYASFSDESLMLAWRVAFLTDCGIANEETFEDSTLGNKRNLELQKLIIWEDGGNPVSMASIAGRTPTGYRVSLVYTPPEHRKKGYAGACVEALTKELFKRGAERCFLYTDLKNPTSNSIYQKIGYEMIGKSQTIRFLPKT